MATKKDRNQYREIRHQRIRRELSGTAVKPRLNVFKSHKNYYLQLIDDEQKKTLAAVSTQEADLKQKFAVRGNLAAAQAVGTLVAQRALEKGIKRVVFDRGGNAYQGAVKAMAEAARKAGLEF